MRDDIVERIEDANLSAPAYRTAIRLLRLAHPDNGYVRLSHDEMAVFCGTDKPGTVRAHLAQLAAANLITYRRNSDVHVHWHGWLPDVLSETSNSRAQTNNSRAQIAEPGSPETDVLSETNNSRAQTNKSRAETSNSRAQIARPHTRDVCLSVCQSTTPSTDEVTDRQTDTPEPNERNRSIALLTDVDVGIDAAIAGQLATCYRFEYLLRQTMTYRRQLATGKAQGPGALLTRIKRGWGSTITEDDRHSELWQRHVPREVDDADGEAARRRKYVPAEYADVIIG